MIEPSLYSFLRQFWKNYTFALESQVAKSDFAEEMHGP